MQREHISCKDYTHANTAKISQWDFGSDFDNKIKKWDGDYIIGQCGIAAVLDTKVNNSYVEIDTTSSSGAKLASNCFWGISGFVSGLLFVSFLIFLFMLNVDDIHRRLLGGLVIAFFGFAAEIAIAGLYIYFKYIRLSNKNSRLY